MEFSIDDKLKLVDDIYINKATASHKFDYIYPFTTENITGYLPLFDMTDKSLLTVGSSCDQALNAILCGANKVTIFDICPFVKEYYYLKKAAIQTLTKEEFLNFFCNHISIMLFNKKDKAFSIRMYYKIREALKSSSDDAKHFWDEVFNKYGGMTIRKRIFSTDEYVDRALVQMNNYLLNDDSYQALGKKLENAHIDFIQGDIFNSEITGNYDNIFLSNLATYYKLEQINKLFLKMLAHLNDEGRILIAYLYETDMFHDDYMEGEPEIYNLFKDFQTFPKGTTLNSFIGVRGFTLKTNRIKDSVITYKKVKKM